MAASAEHVALIAKDDRVKTKADTTAAVATPAAAAPKAAPATDTKQSAEHKKMIDDLTKVYNDYQALQKGFVAPVAHITLEEDANGLEVHIDTTYNGTTYHFESMKLKHLDEIHNNLYSQALVMRQFATGKTQDLTYTTGRVVNLSSRYLNKDPKEGTPKLPNPYSGFIVTDGETRDFLGITILGGGEKPGTSEMARLNSVTAWSHMPAEVVKEYDVNTASVPVVAAAATPTKKAKDYKGTGTAEVCSMLQYGAHLKSKKYKVNGHDLTAIVATARVDNPGSWKSNAKAGMFVTGVDANPNYGPELRYQLSTKPF